MQFVQVHTSDNSYEANFIKDKLEREGIACFLTNENFTTYGLGTSTWLKKIITIVISVMSAIPFSNINNTYFCKDCGTEFKK